MVVEDSALKRETGVEERYYSTHRKAVAEEMVINKVARTRSELREHSQGEYAADAAQTSTPARLKSREEAGVAVGAGGKGGQLWLSALLLLASSSAKVRLQKQRCTEPRLLQHQRSFCDMWFLPAARGKWRGISMISLPAWKCGHSQCLGDHAHAPEIDDPRRSGA